MSERDVIRAGFTVRGRWFDLAHYPDGTSEVLNSGSNIVTDSGLGLAVGALGGLTAGISFWQAGSGQPGWDMEPPDPEPCRTGLEAPVFEKQVIVSYWDRAAESFSPTPTDTIDVRVIFLAEEANGELREFGLLGPEPGCILFNYVIHERLVKTPNFNLERVLRITIERGDAQ